MAVLLPEDNKTAISNIRGGAEGYCSCPKGNKVPLRKFVNSPLLHKRTKDFIELYVQEGRGVFINKMIVIQC
jgi:hypothetical protein